MPLTDNAIEPVRLGMETGGILGRIKGLTGGRNDALLDGGEFGIWREVCATLAGFLVLGSNLANLILRS
jgi:hypothetical protein